MDPDAFVLSQCSDRAPEEHKSGLIRILMCWEGEVREIGFVDVRDLGEVEGDAVEKEIGVSGSVVDADEALEVLVESLRLSIALPAVEVPQNGGGI